MRFVRLALLLTVFGAVGLVGSSAAAVPTPTGLHGFLFTAFDPSTTTFHRTPSFAWKPTSGASRYELQLSTSPTFRENGILYDNRSLQTPVAAPSLTLPWITGDPHSLYARVRALFGGGSTSAWSRNYGFDVIPPAAPTPLPSRAGLLRWTTVEGADRYEVWLVDAAKIEVTKTNVLDEREYYAFHDTRSWIRTVHWRVRAMRLNVSGRLNGLPAADYGPWSPVYTATNPAVVDAPIKLTGTISDSFSRGGTTSGAHTLMPGFAWTGNETLGGVPAQFFRVYVYTDDQCLNRVFTSAVVASPAYAPRISGTLKMPSTPSGVTSAADRFLRDGPEATGRTADGERVVPNEAQPAATPTTTVPGAKKGLTIRGDLGGPIDLWDTNWPEGGYYWTVIPVAPIALGKGKNTKLVYYDLELPQDVCAAGRVQRFGISSSPSLTSGQEQFASGLSANGKLATAAQTQAFYGEPLVAWKPAAGAMSYEIQWSKAAYPFTPRGAQLTLGTSVVLPLSPGTWWYRVRGFDYNLPSQAQEMAWSAPAKLVVAAPKFKVTSTKKKHRKFKVGGSG